MVEYSGFCTPFEKPTEMPKRNTNKITPVLMTSRDCEDLANMKSKELMELTELNRPSIILKFKTTDELIILCHSKEVASKMFIIESGNQYQKGTEDNCLRWSAKGWQNNYFYFLSLRTAGSSVCHGFSSEV